MGWPNVRNISRYAVPFSRRLVELGLVVDDRGIAKHLCSETVLWVEMRDREDGLPIARERVAERTDARRIAGAHRRIDDEHLRGAEHDADVRDERNTAVRDDVHPGCDLDRRAGDGGAWRRCRLGVVLTHGP